MEKKWVWEKEGESVRQKLKQYVLQELNIKLPKSFELDLKSVFSERFPVITAQRKEKVTKKIPDLKTQMN